MKNGCGPVELDATKSKTQNPIQVKYCHPEQVRH